MGTIEGNTVMAMSEKQRQKKLAKRKKSRKIANKPASALAGAGKNALDYAKYPIHECLVPDSLFATGLGEVVVTRKLPTGEIAVSAFLLDVYCLGVKNAFFVTLGSSEYEQNYRASLVNRDDSVNFEVSDPSCVKRLIEGAESYAANLGFKPHADYRRARGLLSGIDAATCTVEYEYGKDGKPLYIPGPSETPVQIKKIMNTLNDTRGDERRTDGIRDVQHLTGTMKLKVN